MLLRLEMANACAPPLIVTPALAVNVIGLPAVPELAGLTDVPVYDPALTSTVSPAIALLAAAPMVQKGCAGVPDPASEHEADVVSTT
jgi:hypothetical protein